MSSLANAPAIEVRDVSKRFRIYREKPTSLKQRLLTSRSRAEDLALRDVAGRGGGLDVRPDRTQRLGQDDAAEVRGGDPPTDLGGDPPAGPPRGAARARRRVPSRTHGQNVYLNASFLGLSRKQTDAAFDIVAFAELEQFIDTEVKFYSSGMLVRLGFAVGVRGARRAPDRRGARGGRRGLPGQVPRTACASSSEGRTIVLVTHALDTVTEICDRAAMLHHGELHAIGMPPKSCARCVTCCSAWPIPGSSPSRAHGRRDHRGADRPPGSSSHGAILSGDPLTIGRCPPERDGRRPRRGLRRARVQ